MIAVIFSLIIHIEDRIYHTPHSLKRCCTIDGGWKLLSFGNKKVGQFIEADYHTICHHRGTFTTISQDIEDSNADDASKVTKAVWGSSTFEVILKQDVSEFRQYNQNRPNQFNKLECGAIGRFGDTKNQWPSSFMLHINDTCSFHHLFIDPLSRAISSSEGGDFGLIHQCRK